MFDFGSRVAAAALALMGPATAASAVTINNGAVTCVDCSVQARSGALDLQAGDRYSVAHPGFLDGAGDPFDVLFEVLEIGAAPGLSPGRVGAFNIRGLNRFVHYRVSTIAAGSASEADPDGERIVVQGLDTVSILDVDSNGGQDFSDVAGANLQIAYLGAGLQRGGLDGLPGAPTDGFEYARLDPELAGDPDDWRAEGNEANDPMHTVAFLAGGGISQFEFVWGATSPDSNAGRTRGWEMEFSASSAVVPLPAGALLVLSGLGVMGAVRAAKRRRAE